MLVRAAPGLKVPKEEQPRDYVAGDEPVLVPDSAYYRRRVADGDLIIVPEADTETGAPSAPKKTKE